MADLFTLHSWVICLNYASLALNVVMMIWMWRRGTAYHRAARVLCELCLMAWPMRQDPRLAQHYINTVGRWFLERRQ